MDHIIDITGYSAVIVILASFAMRDDKKLQKLNLLGCMLWSAHFYFMQEVWALLMMIIACIMVGSAIFQMKVATNMAWLSNIILIPIAGTMAMSGGAGWSALLPILGGFFINTGVSRCSGRGMTLTIMIGQLLWLLAAISMGSVHAVIANVLNVASLSVREILRIKSEKKAVAPSL